MKHPRDGNYSNTLELERLVLDIQLENFYMTEK